MRSLRQIFTLSALATATFFLSACSERGIQAPVVEDGSDPDSEAGPDLLLVPSWSGIAGPIELTMTLDTIYIDGSLVGSGVLGSVHAAFVFDMVGRIAGSVITLDLIIPGEGTVTFEGTVTTDDRIVGVLNGLGFDQFGISLEPVTEDGNDEEAQFDPSQPQAGVTPAFAGEYDGDWTILIRWTDADQVFQTVVGTCPGSIWLEAQSLLDRLFGGNFRGSYLIQASGSCASGSTVSGAVSQGHLREDGGVNFGLQIPGSDGNFFEDVLAGSGVSNDPDLLGCATINADLENQMDGSILSDNLLAAASASLNCPRLTAITTHPVHMSVAIDATKSN